MSALKKGCISVLFTSFALQQTLQHIKSYFKKEIVNQFQINLNYIYTDLKILNYYDIINLIIY